MTAGSVFRQHLKEYPEQHMSSDENKDREEAQELDEATDEQPVAESEQGGSDLEERLAEAEREIDQFKRLAQRAQADLVNYRNRVRSEQESLQARTVERVAARFIEVADQLEIALDTDAAAGVEEKWVSGVKGIYNNLLNVLKSEGFERFDALGEQFDPRRHDALLASPTDEHPPNHVMRQMAAGYLRHGEVVRPAQVEIASAPEDSDGEK